MRAVLNAVAALCITTAALVGQSVTVSVTPASGNSFAPGPLSVSIGWCAVGATLDNTTRTITLNAQDVSAVFNWTVGTQAGCDDFATSAGSVTLGAGSHTFFAHIAAYYEPPPPPQCPPICDSKPGPPDDFALLEYPAAPAELSAPNGAAYVSSIEWVHGEASRQWGTSAPLVSLAPYSSGVLTGGFDVAFAHSTPAYFSLGQAREVTVAYNSATVRPTPVIQFDVSSPTWAPATVHFVQVRRASNGTLLDLLNGSQTVYYSPAGTTPLRLAVAFDAQANAFGTGWHDITVTVTSLPSNQSTTVPTRVLVVDQSGSAFGKGVEVGAIQRIYMKPGSYHVLITAAGGSASFFESFGNCETCSTFTSPAGDPTVLTKITDPILGTVYRRRYPDGSTVDLTMVPLTTKGHIRRAFGIFGDTTQFTWTDTLLTQIRDPMGKTLTLAYSSGKLQSVTDPAGRVTTYSVDGSGRLYRVTDPDTVATNLGYDANNLLTSVTDRGSAVSNFTYDALRRADTTYAPTIQIYTGASARPRSVMRAPERLVWQPERAGTDIATKKLAVRPDTLYALSVGPVNDTIRTVVDRFGGPIKMIGPYGETTTITRDTLGRALVATAPSGHIGRLSWSNYLVSQTKDSITGRTITYQYGANANVTRMTGDITQQDLVYHTGANGPSGALDSVLGANRTVIYSVHRPDALGRDTLITDGGQHKTRIVYDPVWGNVSETKDANGNFAMWFYDSAGRIDSVKTWHNPRGSKTATRYRYDKLNRQTEVTSELGHVTRSVYGPTTLDRVIDPKGQVYKFAYNSLGLLVARHDVADTIKADTLKYDEAGNARTVITRRGDVITMTYDLLGRVRSRAGPDFPVDSFKYDPAQRWMVAWNANQRDSTSFDQAGRLAATRQAMLGGVAYQLSYTYDIRDRLIDRSAPTGGNIAKYRYNAASGPLDTLCGAGACVAFKRNGELRRDTMIYNPGGGGSWRQLRYYDSLHAVARDSFNLVGLDTLFGGRWTFDPERQLRTEDSSATGARKRRLYQYDDVGRLLNACDVTQEAPLLCNNEYGQQGNAYAYDSAGNRIDPAANAVIGTGNRTSSFKGYSLTYNANGNLISKTGPGGNPAYTYVWDALGRLKEVQNGGVPIATFKYDALGRRVSGTAPDGTTERYVYDRDHVILDVNGSHAIKTEYGYHPGMDRLLAIRHVQAPAWTGIALTDPVVGSIRGIANLSGGALRKKYQFTAWGQGAADTGVVTRFRMAGREYDQATGLYYMRARYYDPELGRFISEDPIGIAGGLNLYSYAGNDPVNSRDPTGLDECMETSPMAGAAGDTITLPPVVVCGDGGTGDPPLPPCAYVGTCGGFDPPDGWYPPPEGFQPPPMGQRLNVGETDGCWGEAADLLIDAALDLTGFALLKKGLKLLGEARRLSSAAALFANKGKWIGDGQSFHNVVVNNVVPELRGVASRFAAVQGGGTMLSIGAMIEGGDPLDQALDIISLAPVPFVGTATSAAKLGICLVR